MALYIRDSEVDALAAKVRAATKSRNKTEAVRLALEHELQRLGETPPLDVRFAKAIEIVRAIRADATAQGLKGADDFDMKAFTDEMWGC